MGMFLNVWFLCSFPIIYTKCIKSRKCCIKLFLYIFCYALFQVALLSPFPPQFISLFISSFHCFFHLPPSWITALLTCFVQSTHKHIFLWRLPAAWLSLAHLGSAMAPVFLLTTVELSGARLNNQMVPSLFQAFPGSPEQLAALSPLQPPTPCTSLVLPAWFRRSWEGSEWPGVQVGAILRIFIISFKSSLCSGEQRGQRCLTEVEG